VRLEVCTVALRLFKADNATLVPEVVAVGNVLTSQIAYQNRGYALITLN
jgi:intracellular sulfur oxidation DsrE/DsrF family protein